MGKRTLASCWKQYEKLCDAYLQELKPRDETLEKLVDLTEKANRDDIGAALSTLFVKPYLTTPIDLVFCMEMENGEIPDWMTRYVEEEARIDLHPLAVVKYIRRMQNMVVTEEDKTSFVHHRYVSFLAELGKLPGMHILFMLALQRVAYMMEIAHLEKRGGIIEVAEGESYHTLLWAFKEVESFVRRTSGVNIRSHYGIYWYESDWITGR